MGGRQPRVATVVATWNRKESLLRALAAHSAQEFDLTRVDMVVVDNASTDGTMDAISTAYAIDRVVENHGRGLDFQFRNVTPPPRSLPSSPFRSLTVVRNMENAGGTGGFNAGMAFARDVLDTDTNDPVDFVWLLDDDAFVDPRALGMQLGAMASDSRIGLVGARSVNPEDRTTTLESTVYFDWQTGHLMDDAPPTHAQFKSHQRFLDRVGSTRRGSGYGGIIDCDVCAAASLLARMKVLRDIGLWDPRYFIYEDDADWCLRAGRAGYRVVSCMDAVVYHRTWHARIAPRLNCVRMFYVSRNRLWTMGRVMHEPYRSGATRDWHRTLLRFAIDAAWHRRTTHASLLLRALRDSLCGVGGKCPIPIPPETSIIDSLRQVRALEQGAKVVILCDRPHFAEFASQMRSEVRSMLRPGEHEPMWIELARNDLPLPPESCRRVLYSRKARSKLRRQPTGLTACVVFDGAGDFPLVSSCPNVHIDGPSRLAQVEQDSVWARLMLTFAWLTTSIHAWWWRSSTIRALRSTSSEHRHHAEEARSPQCAIESRSASRESPGNTVAHP